MLQLTQRLGLDLPNTFACDRELSSYLLQRMFLVHANAETHAQDSFLPRRDGSKRTRRDLAEVRLDRRFVRRHRLAVFDEVAEVTAVIVSHRHLERERFLGG